MGKIRVKEKSSKMNILLKPWYASCIVFLFYEFAIMKVEYLPFNTHYITQYQITYDIENYIDQTIPVAIVFFFIAITFMKWWPNVGWSIQNNLKNVSFLWPSVILIIISLLFVSFSDIQLINSMIILIINTLMIGICEEFMYRGILFHGALSSFGVWRAVWITSIIFGATHIPWGFITGNFNASMIQAFYAFIFGFYMVALRIRLSSIIPGIIIHWIWDFVAYLPSTQGNQLLPMELLFFFYGLWILRNYLPTRYQYPSKRNFHIIESSIHTNHSCTCYKGEKNFIEPQLISYNLNKPKLINFDRSCPVETNFAGVSIKEASFKEAKIEYSDNRLVMKDENVECQILTENVDDMELYIRTLFDWATKMFDYSVVEGWNTDEYSLINDQTGFFKVHKLGQDDLDGLFKGKYDWSPEPVNDYNKKKIQAYVYMKISKDEYVRLVTEE